MNKTLKRLAEPGVRMYFFFMLAFAAAALYFGMYELAAIEAGVTLALAVYSLLMRRRREKQLTAYMEKLTYDTENAKNNTLMKFPLPISAFRLEDSRIIWGNEMFFDMVGATDGRMDTTISDLVPEFSSKWLIEGKTQYPALLEMKGRRYQLHGNIIRTESGDENSSFMGITYWLDVTDYDNIRQEYEATRPIAGIIVIDNLDELTKNQPDRVKNDIRDAVEDRLAQWRDEMGAILKRFERDRYLMIFESRYLDKLEAEKFKIIESIHEVSSPSGVNATISIGLGKDASGFGEAMQFANVAIELALSRGGDQTVVKNKLSFEFYGGRGNEIEKRTKVKSRVMANTLSELIKDSSGILVMGHRYADLDALGGAVAACCLARKFGLNANIVMDTEKNAAGTMIEKLRASDYYKDRFIDAQEAILKADGRTLLIVVDTNRPEQTESRDLIEACNKVAVIDHHRVGATYVQNAALGFIEPYASSVCELMTEILQELAESGDVSKLESEAILAGIVLDTKNFTIRTGDRTFDAASWLRRAGADTAEVKKLFKTGMADTMAKYSILQQAKLYKGVAIAAPTEKQNRIVAAQAADEMLNISGVDASVVVAPGDDGKIFASARSIGEMNVQILMEKLGGGGNRSAAAVQFEETDMEEALEKLYDAIDEYLGG